MKCLAGFHLPGLWVLVFRIVGGEVETAGGAELLELDLGFEAVLGFHKERMRRVAEAIADEARAKYNEHKKQGFTEIYQGLTMCSPNINIFRDPRWGRGQETYGEDSVLTGMMAVEFEKGLQGEGTYRKVDATLKHFAVHSGPESDRRGFNVDVDETTLFDTYLYAFAYCIRHADPSAVMGAYNAVDGTPCVASRYLLQEILRDKFGFRGFVESDANSVEYLDRYHIFLGRLRSRGFWKSYPWKMRLERICHRHSSGIL